MSSSETAAVPESAESTAEAPQKLNLQVKVDKVGTCKRHVLVTVSREDIDRYFRTAYDEFAPGAAVPGFRPGRAPRRLVEKSFREQMGRQVKGTLLMDCVSQVAESADFSAISEPVFDYDAVKIPEDGPLHFEFDIEVRPEFDIPEWKGLALKKYVHTYTEQEIRSHLNKLLQRYGVTVLSTDREVAATDRVTIDIDFVAGDQVVSTLAAQDVPVRKVLNFADGNIEGFDTLVLGKKPGDQVECQVKVSENAELEEWRGKELTARITLRKASYTVLPEITPAFLDQIGGFEDEQALLTAVRAELERQLFYKQQQLLRTQITSALTRNADWDLPTDLLRRQAARELDRTLLEMKASGYSDEQVQTRRNQVRQNSLRMTAISLKEHFILERLAEEFQIEASDDDYRAEIQAIARQNDESERKVRARLEKRGQMDALRNQIIERRVIEMITSQAQITEEELQLAPEDSFGLEHAICGKIQEAAIPEAKPGGQEQPLPGQPGSKS